MKKTITAAVLISSLFNPAISQAAPDQGDLRNARGVPGGFQIWHAGENKWLTGQRYLELEMARLGGPTYGTVNGNNYPDYDKVSEWETLIDRLPDGRTCPMVFFHQRWRRLGDVLALDERMRNYGGCANVFD